MVIALQDRQLCAGMSEDVLRLDGVGSFIAGPRHGREKYFQVKAIVKSIFFSKKLSRQSSSQLCDQKLSSRQLSCQLFGKQLSHIFCQLL